MAKNQSRVGYKNPPVHTRFQKGTSGNRKGRPQGSLNVRDTLDRILEKRTKVTLPNGRHMTVSTVEAYFLQLRKKALEGNPEAMKMFHKILQEHERSAADRDAKRPLTIILSGADADL